jgi:IclR family transcriptional regulator, KDG regulon repressor
MHRGKAIRKEVADSAYVVGPVFKALRVLEFVGESGRDVSLTEVATALGLPKTTAFRYLQTLSATMFLCHDVYRDRYGMGAQFRRLAEVDKALSRLRELAVPMMRELSRTFNETINLAVEANGEVVYIEIVEPTRAPRMEARIGSRHPMHSTALGKAILANLCEAERDAVLTGTLLERTHRTVTETRALTRQLREVQDRGYAIEVGENEEEAMCIGVSILDELARPVAALSLSAPQRRMTDDLVRRAGRSLRQVTMAISQGTRESVTAA